MSTLHTSNLHGQGTRPRQRYHFARQRGQDNQKVKQDEHEHQKKEETESSSSSGIIVVLLIMIGLTWGVAATAYFEVVDYKALIAESSETSAADVMDFISALYPFQYDAVRHPLPPYDIIDKRRPVTGTSPAQQMKKCLKRATKETKPEARIVDTASDEQKEKRDVAEEPKAKVVKQAEERPEEKQAKPEQNNGEKKPKEDKERGGETKDRIPEKAGEEEKSKKAKKKPSITSKADKAILDKLKAGERLLTEKSEEKALEFFQNLVKDHPESPRARYGRARAEENMASKERSNPRLLQAVKTYDEVAELPDCPIELMKKALTAKSEKQMFLGRMKPALETQLRLAKKFPRDLEIINKLGVRYLVMGQNKAAKKVYEQALRLDPDDGFALVHMGFVLKTDGDWAESINYLQRGTESNEPGTQEGKFYFHLGDALYRTNRTQEAEEVYEIAAEKGLFRSKYQRSLYNVDRLRGQPYWTPEEAGVKDYVKKLEMNWKMIRDEAMSVMDKDTGLFQLEEESLRDTGEWRQFTLYARGAKDEGNCKRTPKTCNIIERMPNAKGCRRGQVKFSVMMPGTHVWPHTGPTNCRLRMHLGLVIPTTGSGARLACAGETRTWQEGKVLIFDDSFEHEVWQEAESLRLILIVDVWHPELTEKEKKTLTAI